MLNTLRAVEEPRPNIMRSPGSGLSFQGMDPGMVNQSLPKSEYRRGMSQDEGSILIQFAPIGCVSFPDIVWKNLVTHDIQKLYYAAGTTGILGVVPTIGGLAILLKRIDEGEERRSSSILKAETEKVIGAFMGSPAYKRLDDVKKQEAIDIFENVARGKELAGEDRTQLQMLAERDPAIGGWLDGLRIEASQYTYRPGAGYAPAILNVNGNFLHMPFTGGTETQKYGIYVIEPTDNSQGSDWTSLMIAKPELKKIVSIVKGKGAYNPDVTRDVVERVRAKRAVWGQTYRFNKTGSIAHTIVVNDMSMEDLGDVIDRWKDLKRIKKKTVYINMSCGGNRAPEPWVGARPGLEPYGKPAGPQEALEAERRGYYIQSDNETPWKDCLFVWIIAHGSGNVDPTAGARAGVDIRPGHVYPTYNKDGQLRLGDDGSTIGTNMPDVQRSPSGLYPFVDRVHPFDDRGHYIVNERNGEIFHKQLSLVRNPEGNLDWVNPINGEVIVDLRDDPRPVIPDQNRMLRYKHMDMRLRSDGRYVWGRPAHGLKVKDAISAEIPDCDRPKNMPLITRNNGREVFHPKFDRFVPSVEQRPDIGMKAGGQQGSRALATRPSTTMSMEERNANRKREREKRALDDEERERKNREEISLEELRGKLIPDEHLTGSPFERGYNMSPKRKGSSKSKLRRKSVKRSRRKSVKRSRRKSVRRPRRKSVRRSRRSKTKSIRR